MEENILIQVNTVDAFQAREQNIVILVTTHSKTPGSAARADTSQFIKDSRRATVALSRAKSGLILIADFEILAEGGVWRRFVEKAQQHVPIVNVNYIQLMNIKSPNRGSNGLLLDEGRSIEEKGMKETTSSKETKEEIRKRKQLSCHTCGKFGHFTRDCRRK